MLRFGRTTIIEPSVGSFTHTLLVLVEELCHAAATDPRSPRYCFAFPRWEIVEPVRQMLTTMDRVAWCERDPKIQTKNGQLVIAGPSVPRDWFWARVVVVCSGSYPAVATIDALDKAEEVAFVFDPQDPPRTEARLRAMAAAS